MILFEWDAPEGNPGKCAYTCMLSYFSVVSHLSFNFLCLLLLKCIYLSVYTVKPLSGITVALFPVWKWDRGQILFNAKEIESASCDAENC